MSLVETELRLQLQKILKLRVKVETVTGLLIASGRGTGRIGGADIEHVSVERTYICPPEHRDKEERTAQSTSTGGQTKQSPGQAVDEQQAKRANTTQAKREEVNVRVPYIPGSSLKGRIRSLLEVALGLPLYSSDGKIWAHTPAINAFKAFVIHAKSAQGASKSPGGDEANRLTLSDVLSLLARQSEKDGQISGSSQSTSQQTNLPFDYLFGIPSIHLDEIKKEIEDKEKNNIDQSTLQKFLNTVTPTPLLVDDIFPDEDYVCKIYEENGIVTFEDFIEEKNENRLDRITSAADPRTIVRVKPGVRFVGNISLLIYDKNAHMLSDFLKLLVNGMKLLEATYLGASGSRGYGRIRFVEIKATVLDPATMSETELETFKSVDELASGIQNLVSLVGVSK